MLNVTPKDYAEGKTFYENLKKSNSSNLGYLKNTEAPLENLLNDKKTLSSIASKKKKVMIV